MKRSAKRIKNNGFVIPKKRMLRKKQIKDPIINPWSALFRKNADKE